MVRSDGVFSRPARAAPDTPIAPLRRCLAEWAAASNGGKLCFAHAFHQPGLPFTSTLSLSLRQLYGDGLAALSERAPCVPGPCVHGRLQDAGCVLDGVGGKRFRSRVLVPLVRRAPGSGLHCLGRGVRGTPRWRRETIFGYHRKAIASRGAFAGVQVRRKQDSEVVV